MFPYLLGHKGLKCNRKKQEKIDRESNDMKKLLALAFAIMIVFTLAACGDHNSKGSNSNDIETISNPDNKKEDTSKEINNKRSQYSTGNNDNSDSSGERIKVTLDSGEIIIYVYDNPTSRNFWNNFL